MPNLKWIRAVLLAAALIAGHEVSTGSDPGSPRGQPAWGGGSDRVSLLTSVSPDPANAASTFYSVRRDRRRCVSPLCGGYFVRRVNLSSTRCANGRFMSECYVAEIDWNGQPESDSADLLVRGSIVAKRFGRFGNLGELRVIESWNSIGSGRPVGTFYHVRDRGVRCITFPCPTHVEAKLNSSFSRNIAGVNLEGAGLGEKNTSVVYAAMTGPDGVIATGNDVGVTGPGGRLFELRATQVYVRSKTNSGSMKPCFKTGCSSQVCSDEPVVTTCEFRPEYACYQKAECARQADGNCGFTKTPELTACLAKK